MLAVRIMVAAGISAFVTAVLLCVYESARHSGTKMRADWLIAGLSIAVALLVALMMLGVSGTQASVFSDP